MSFGKLREKHKSSFLFKSSQPTFTCSKLTLEIVEQGVK